MTTTAPSFCGSCGTASAPGSLFCKNCGTAIGESRSASAVQPLPTVGLVGAAQPGLSVSPATQNSATVADDTPFTPASFGSRFGAFLFDGLVPLVLAYGPFFFFGLGLIGLLAGAVLAIVWCIVLWAMMAISGTSPGKVLVGIRVIRMDNSGAPGWGLAVARFFLRSVLMSFTLGIAGLSPLFDGTGQNRAWWDKAVGTAVIKGKPARPGLLGDSSRAVSPLASAVEPEASWDATPPVAAAKVATTTPTSWSDRPATTPGTQAASSSARVSSPPPLSTQPPPHVEVPDAMPWSRTPVTSVGVIAAVPGKPADTRFEESPLPESPHERTQLSARNRVAVTKVSALLDTGAVLEFEPVVLIGRDPAVALGENAIQLIALDDSTRSVSKTHLKIETAGEGTFVTDRHSTNGVSIRFSSGSEQICVPGERTMVPRGATIVFGDRHLTLQDI